LGSACVKASCKRCWWNRPQDGGHLIWVCQENGAGLIYHLQHSSLLLFGWTKRSILKVLFQHLNLDKIDYRSEAFFCIKTFSTFLLLYFIFIEQVLFPLFWRQWVLLLFQSRILIFFSLFCEKEKFVNNGLNTLPWQFSLTIGFLSFFLAIFKTHFCFSLNPLKKLFFFVITPQVSVFFLSEFILKI